MLASKYLDSRLLLHSSPSSSPHPHHPLKISLYQPLKGSEIRLLRLNPGRWDDPIECDLEVVALEDNPSYAALSYAWGDPTDTVEINPSGRPWRVTRSLFGWLRRIRAFLSDDEAYCAPDPPLSEELALESKEA